MLPSPSVSKVVEYIPAKLARSLAGNGIAKNPSCPKDRTRSPAASNFTTPSSLFWKLLSYRRAWRRKVPEGPATPRVMASIFRFLVFAVKLVTSLIPDVPKELSREPLAVTLTRFVLTSVMGWFIRYLLVGM